MEFLIDYLVFAAKFITVVVVLAAPVLLALLFRQARDANDAPRITVTRLNDRIRDTQLLMEAAMLPPKVYKKHLKALRKAEKERAAKAEDESAKTYVLNFDGDIRASAVEQLREEISAVISVAKPIDRVICVLESGGGTIHGYGLAASQLARLGEAEINLTVAVDRIAASGGYMMACVANEIVAAPFAIIGSIGVVAQMPNFHRLLKKHDIDFEQITAGEYKRTLTLFGENSDADREKFQQDINDAHVLFKQFIETHRPQVDIASVATGEYWFARRALELKLIDRLETSDDLINRTAAEGDIYRVRVESKQSMLARLGEAVSVRLKEVFP